MHNPFDILQQELAEVKQQNKLILEHLQALAAKQDQETYLTVNETAKKLKVSRQCVGTWTKNGIINRHVIGRKPFYLKSEIEAASQQVRLYRKPHPISQFHE